MTMDREDFDEYIEDRHRAYLARLTPSQRFRRWLWLYQEALWLLSALITLAIVAAVFAWRS